jgi:hypothetical protein
MDQGEATKRVAIIMPTSFRFLGMSEIHFLSGKWRINGGSAIHCLVSDKVRDLSA